jgi:redox-sensitive bicupin YhaK (pirin superfamily)
MKTTLHRADTRGQADHGWLLSRHTFSFGQYRDPERMGFGLLRVINDDVVQSGKGFGTHPHENMEIVSIPLSGELLHHDSMGNTQHITAGEVQIMSAGTGIAHSEYNASDTDPVGFLQIWVLPKEIDIAPRYDQKVFAHMERQNEFQVIVSPDIDDGGVWINQDVRFSLGDFDGDAVSAYTVRRPGDGVYFFVIEGFVTVAGEVLGHRDGLGVEDVSTIEIKAARDCQVLAIEVPMQ